MSYINPNSDIYVLHDIPLDPTQDNTLWFANLSAQTSYFTSKAKYQFTKQTYQRVKRGYIRLQKRAEDLYDCNYLMFRNTAYGTKWFYAFLDSVDYINDSVCEIRYTIDPMQTWFFDYLLEQCLVIREHSQSDNIGDNLVPEDVNLGEYVSGFPYQTDYFTDWKIVLVSTSKLVDSSGHVLPIQQVPDGGFWGGVYGACNYYYFPATATGISDIKTILNDLGIFNKPENIVAMFMLPSAMLPVNSPPYDTAADSLASQRSIIQDYTLPFNERGEIGTNNTIVTANYCVFNGYQPKNKKLYTYPYNYFVAYNNQGELQEFKYEYFPKDPTTNNAIIFDIVCDGSMEPTIVCIPVGYMQMWGTSSAENDYTKAISISNFPKCTWATNDLGAKLVQGGISLALLAATKGVSIPGAYSAQHIATEPLKVETAGELPPTQSLANRNWVANNLPVQNIHDKVDIKMQPGDAIAAGFIARSVFNSHTRPSLGRGNSMFVAGGMDFFFKPVFLAAPFAEIVDNYFQCYGYACNKVKIPNIHVRDHWTYTRTANCCIKPYPASQQHPVGGIPADDMKKICDLFNRGIRFWVNASEVGNYYLTNDPISFT